jgi:predicted phage gp36 major capsid-like protein
MASAVKNGARAVIGGIEYVLCGERWLKSVAGGDGTFTTTEPTSIDEWNTYLSEIQSRMQTIDEEYRGKLIDPESDAGAEWNHLGEQRELAEKTIEQLEARSRFIASTRDEGGNAERGAEFNVPRAGVARGEDIYDLSTVRMSMGDPERASASSATAPCVRSRRGSPHQLDADGCRSHIERLIERHDSADSAPSRARSPAGSWRRAARATSGRSRRRSPAALTSDEQRALSVGTGSAGGFAVVYTLDPTIIPTSNLSVNPFRRIARVETIAGTNEWRGVTSAGVTAAYAAEATEASDNSPTLAQPSVVVEKRADASCPFSIELGAGLGLAPVRDGQPDPGREGRPRGHQVHDRHGTAPAEPGHHHRRHDHGHGGRRRAFAVADLYAVEQALGPRFRPRAQWLGNRFTYNKVRQFDTAGGASQLWMPYPAPLREGLNNDPPRGNMGAELIGYPANEDSAMASALTTGSKILVLGDFRYFVIVDRVGMDIEVIPHLFGANRRPTGQRGFYAYWRNSAKVLDANAFRVLVTG